jgi:eukaryotic-like serine/threonine-protein kinase
MTETNVGDIQLLRLLGRGGMGTVWLGRRAGVLVAVKIMLPKLHRDPLAIARFERELRILRAMRAKHAVRLVAHGTHDGQRYLVMENIEGSSLADRVDDKGRPPRALSFRIMRKLLASLREIHEEGVIHRDIKPANIMLCGSGAATDVRLVDFGVASSVHESTFDTLGDDMMVGTAPYMSPEQLVDGGIGVVHEDMWAAAVVAYECLLGRMPFDGPTFDAVCIAVKRGVFLPPSDSLSGLAPSMDAWFARAFRKRTHDRFSDVAAMAAAWDDAVAATSPSARIAVWAMASTRVVTAAGGPPNGITMRTCAP